ncbi:MAG: hypothetical protein CME63_06910 [Halobacteriovoraceae bacterium]|nr:hypothetical protein [Halobacteriovoraceae bacterium]|tara:strand:- start:88361 stop:88891 length:531 start_codon:yes stop_codon:yes gene_type:complete
MHALGRLRFFSLCFTLCFSIFFIFTFSAEASSQRVGDLIEYSGRVNSQASSLKMRYTHYDQGSMTQLTQFFTEGQMVAEHTEVLDESSIITMETAGVMVGLCLQFGGVHEYLELPVGKTLTCRITAAAISTQVYEVYKEAFADAGTLWLGPFPVTGIAQMEVDGALYQVTKYHWNE